MVPTRRKDNSKRSSKSGAPVSRDSWRSEIERVTLNDEEWRCIVAMIVETDHDHARYIEFFNEAAEEETREKIFALPYDKLIRNVKSIAISDLDQGICHFASEQLTEAGEAAMSLWLLSRLIKFFVHRARTKSLKNRDARVGTRSGKAASESEETLKKTGTTAAKSKGGSGDAKTSFKAGTRVRKRGEEWRDKVRIEDAPVDGADLYVVLSGFRDPDLLPELLKAGVPLTAVFGVAGGVSRKLESGRELRKFWSTVDAALKKPAAAETYCRIIFQTFCPPPELPEELEEAEVQLWKADAYRRVSFLVYDLDDIVRQHASYIGNMRLQSGLEETRPEIQARETYDAIMRLVPEECASVPLVLDALLEQVVIGAANGGSREREGDANEGSGNVERVSKIDCLNREFDVLEVGRGNTHPGNSDPRLIIHGDTLGAKTHHCSMELIATLSGESEDSGVDFGIRVLRQSRIAALWRDLPNLTTDRMTMYAFHIAKISDCFDAGEDCASTIHHYLSLLLFDKMINDEKSRSNLQEREDLERKTSFPSPEGTKNVRRASDTLVSLRSGGCQESSPFFIFRSDSNVDYKKSIRETFECPELFQLVDAREVLGSGSIFVPETSYPGPGETFLANLNVDEFDSVQLLSPDIFSQIFNEFSEEYNTVETRYFAPTDSVLVILRNRLTRGDIFQQRYAASIRTPVCLGDYFRFVVEEEKEWIEREEAAHAAARLAEKSAPLKDPEEPGTVSRYTDADFVLPNSIKGTKMRKQKSGQALVGATETDVELSPAEKGRESGVKEVGKNAGAGSAKKIKDKEAGNNSTKKKRKYSVRSIASSRSTKDDQPLAFLGYDVGNYRVQVSGSRTEFLSEDGTRVKVDLEEWSYAEPGLRVAINLFGNYLTAHSVANNRETPPIFHFATRNGIIVGFDPREAAGSGIAFRASWPSGLIVETRPDLGASVPFYVKQSYLSKGPECRGILNETCRVFLSSGTVIVFLDDGSVRLLHSNGTIVTRSGFASAKRRIRSNGRVRKKNGGDFTSSASRLKNSKTNIEGANAKLESLESSSKSNSDESMRDTRILDTLRSVVLDPEGRRYEVFDGRITRELDEELVRTLSDYEVGEKFIRRSDGTDILINSDGLSAACFPDGSRITTGFLVEKDLVHCDWTEDEYNRFDHPVSDEDVSPESLDEGESSSIKNHPMSDGFVSILLTSCMEHKNYSTVIFDRSKSDCTLSMPGEVNVSISSDHETIGVTVNASTSLKVGRQDIVLTGRTGETSEICSTSVYNLEHFFESSSTLAIPLLCTTDSFGNVFKVDFEGNTSYEKLIQGTADGEKGNHFSSFRRPSTSLANLPAPNSRGCRLFVVRRDLTAFEYLHSSVREAQEDEACREETASIFHFQIPDHPGQDLFTTLTALNPITVSRGWLQPYKVSSIRLTNADRRDLVRSTYSVPWDYLIPYGKKFGIGIRDHGWNEPLKTKANEISTPEVLLARTTQSIKTGDKKMILRKLRIALACYWKKTMNRFNEYRSFIVSRRSVISEEREIEEWLNDYALGRKKTFNRALYSSGLVKNRQAEKISTQSRSTPRINSNEMTKEENEWYKNCLNDRIVPPYFADVPGACFTWIMECVNRIGDNSLTENKEKRTRTGEK